MLIPINWDVNANETEYVYRDFLILESISLIFPAVVFAYTLSGKNTSIAPLPS